MPESDPTPRALEMRDLFLRQERGETLESLAQKVGLKSSTLKWWRSRLRRDGLLSRKQASARFVEVSVKKNEQRDPLVVEVAGVRLLLPASFDAEALARAITVLRRC